MKHLLSSLLVIAAMSFVSLAHAQQAKVIKVKGQQAIVQFPSGVIPTVGQSLDVGGSGSTVPAHTVGYGTRDHSLTVGTELSVLSSSAGGSRTNFELTGRYGWNLQTIEFGPSVIISYLNPGSGTTTTALGIGGFFDFNFVPNVIGQSMVYGVGGELAYRRDVSSTNGIDTAIPVISGILGGNIKYFGLSDHVALRGDAGLNIQRSTPPIGDATTNTGLLLRGSLAFYF